MKISIIMASLNRENTIVRAINSIISQNYKNFEIIIQDGGSTDETLSLAEALNDDRIFIESSADLGIYDALNKGLQRATGDIVGFVHTDDVLCSPDIFDIIINTVCSTSSDGIYGDLIYSKLENPFIPVRNWIAGDFEAQKLIHGWMIPHPTLYLKRTIYEECGYFDLQYSISADYEMFLRLITKNKYKLHYLEMQMVNMSLGGASNKDFRNIFRKSFEDYHILKRYNFPALYTILAKNLRKLPQVFKGSSRRVV